MDWNAAYQIGSLIVAVLFGSQGVRAWAKQRDIKKDHHSKSKGPSAAADYLTGYYQTELRTLRRQHQLDELYIDALEAHCYENNLRPPQRPTKLEGEH